MSAPGLLTRRKNARVRAAAFPGAAVESELATAVLMLQGSGHALPTERQRFVAHHASVLLGLLRARARFKAKLNAGDDDDGDSDGARLPSEACFPALLEGARAMYATLDAVTRVSHTKRYTIQQNRQKCHDAMTLLARANRDFRRREKRGELGPRPGRLMQDLAARATTQRMAFSVHPNGNVSGPPPMKLDNVAPSLLAHMEFTSRLEKTDELTHISSVVEDLYADRISDKVPPGERMTVLVKRNNGTYWQLIKGEHVHE